MDIGCGKNENIADFGHLAKKAIGIDVLDHPERVEAPFLLADMRSIPLPSEYADLITLRFVVEHLQKIPADFSEVLRLLKPGGNLIILTTNSWSPLIFLPRLVSFRVKRWVIQHTFGVQSDDIFETYHRFNSFGIMKRGVPPLRLSRLDFIEQVPFDKALLTIVFGLWYSMVRFSPLKYLRSNLLAVFSMNSRIDHRIQE